MNPGNSGNQARQPQDLFNLDRLKSGTEQEMTLALIHEYFRILDSTGAAIAYWRMRDPNDPSLDAELTYTIDEDSHPIEVAMWVEAVADEAVMGVPGVASTTGSKHAVGMRQAFLKRFYGIDASPDDPNIDDLIREAAARREEYTTTLHLALDNHTTLDKAHELYLGIQHASQVTEEAGAAGHAIYVIGTDDDGTLMHAWEAFNMPHYRPDLNSGDDFSSN